VDKLIELSKLPRPFDAIIIELSGMADPAPVAYTFTGTSVGAFFRVDSIVCVVDTKHISQHLHDKSRSEDDVNEAVQQVAFADRILLNKVDLVSDAEKATVEAELKSINSFARTIECQQSSVPLREILGVSTFTIDQATMLEQEFEYVEREEAEARRQLAGVEEDGLAECCINQTCGSAPGCPKAAAAAVVEAEERFQAAAAAAGKVAGGEAAGAGVAGAAAAGPGQQQPAADTKTVVRKDGRTHQFGGVTSVAIKLPDQLHCIRFSLFMSEWLSEHGKDLYRSKGICCMAGRGEKYVFQGVHDNVQCSPSETEWSEGEPRSTTLVFIGRNLKKEVLQEELQKCCMQEGEEVPEWDDSNMRPHMEAEQRKQAVEACTPEKLEELCTEHKVSLVTEAGDRKPRGAVEKDLLVRLTAHQKEADAAHGHGHGHGHHHHHHHGDGDDEDCKGHQHTVTVATDGEGHQHEYVIEDITSDSD
jgi:G3E family GTPase